MRNIALLVDAGAGGTASGVVTWDGWQKANYTERVKTGVQPLVDAWAALSAPTR